jgi:PIN domain nuclease of toxin-antitoxin system
LLSPEVEREPRDFSILESGCQTRWNPALATVELPWDHRGSADRTSVAIALARKAPPVTCDERIAAFHAQTLW